MVDAIRFIAKSIRKLENKIFAELEEINRKLDAQATLLANVEVTNKNLKRFLTLSHLSSLNGLPLSSMDELVAFETSLNLPDNQDKYRGYLRSQKSSSIPMTIRLMMGAVFEKTFAEGLRVSSTIHDKLTLSDTLILSIAIGTFT